jgi:hypothetical protein
MKESLALLLITALAACQGLSKTPLPSPTVVLPEATAPATPFPTTTSIPPTETIAVRETSTPPILTMREDGHSSTMTKWGNQITQHLLGFYCGAILASITL